MHNIMITSGLHTDSQIGIGSLIVTRGKTYISFSMDNYISFIKYFNMDF